MVSDGVAVRDGRLSGRRTQVGDELRLRKGAVLELGCSGLLVTCLVASVALAGAALGELGDPLTRGAAGVWLVIVAMGLVEHVEREGWRGLLDLLGALTREHAAWVEAWPEATPDGASERVERALCFGFWALGCRWTRQRIPLDALISIGRVEGQASGRMGRDMDDWSVRVAFRDARGFDAAYVLGSGPAERAKAHDEALVDRLRHEGLGLSYAGQLAPTHVVTSAPTRRPVQVDWADVDWAAAGRRPWRLAVHTALLVLPAVVGWRLGAEVEQPVDVACAAAGLAFVAHWRIVEDGRRLGAALLVAALLGFAAAALEDGGAYVALAVAWVVGLRALTLPVRPPPR